MKLSGDPDRLLLRLVLQCHTIFFLRDALIVAAPVLRMLQVGRGLVVGCVRGVGGRLPLPSATLPSEYSHRIIDKEHNLSPLLMLHCQQGVGVLVAGLRWTPHSWRTPESQESQAESLDVPHLLNKATVDGNLDSAYQSKHVRMISFRFQRYDALAPGNNTQKDYHRRTETSLEHQPDLPLRLFRADIPSKTFGDIGRLDEPSVGRPREVLDDTETFWMSVLTHQGVSGTRDFKVF
ncbi:hypothetical protein E2C01_022530 [Portunus trituberculatus]|uniref:Uncharacterized protein n=1 Tax=Portunus trituberculatus TaxID=210409 RepID=A0A5B7E5L8_PORTR|nr:hypothetical protein [Portunus trituberculatus]